MNPDAPDRASQTRHWLALLALALVFTLLNAVKPLAMDDAAYHQFATHFAQASSDPYGFSLLWYNEPKPGPWCYTPPVFLYWWSFALRLFGDQPFLWKLWTLPFGILLAGGLYGVFRHFSRGLEMPLTVMTVLSATFLPSMNLMLDVPCAALGLTALALLLHAFKLESARAAGRRAGQVPSGRPYLLAVLSGLAAGLAVETKYSGVVAPAALALATLVYWRPVLGLVAGLVAALVFLGVEYAIFLRYDTSVFINGLQTRDQLLTGVFNKVQRTYGLVTILGGVAPAVLLLGRAALGAHRLAVVALGTALALSLGVMGVIWGGLRLTWIAPFDPPEDQIWKFTLGEVFFPPVGLALAWTVLVASWRLCRVERGLAGLAARRADWFLVLWLGLEVVGYFAIAPVPCVRRVLGVVVVTTVILGRLASRTCRTPERRWLIHGIAAFGVLHGLFYQVIDHCDARALETAPRAAAEFIREYQPDATIWFTGFWGFKFHAERLGMKPVYPGTTILAAKDWLVVPSPDIERQTVDLSNAPVRRIIELTADLDPVPYKVVPFYYLGYYPLHGHTGPRLSVTVYRVLQDFTAVVSSEDGSAP